MDTASPAVLFFVLALLSSSAHSYSFNFESTPSQCGTVSISITGSGGSPPYRLSIIPWGNSPLQSGQLEVRKILDMPFNDSSHISFTLPYPQNSQFVAIVSDKNGTDSNFASGGITVPVSINEKQNDDCIPNTEVQGPFTFSTNPLGSLTTCQEGKLTWNGSSVQGNVKFWGAIPGGTGFIINGQSDQDQGKQALDWTPSIATGTGCLVIAGDNRGFGSGGSFQSFLQPGNGTTGCLNSNSPKTTSGSPAGGSYPTDSSGHRTGGSGTNIGAIVGGVIGGIAGIAIIGLLVFFLLRRRRNKRRISGEPVDLLEGREGGDHEENGDVPQEYLPEPYHIPRSAPTETEMSESTALHPLTARDRRVSQLSVTTQTRLSSEESSSNPGRSTAITSAKSAAGPPTLRPVNIIQHEDAGPSEEGQKAEGETVELPPAYTNIRK